MGNRGQIQILEDTRSNGIYLYAHYAHGLPSKLKQALLRAKAGRRLDDALYLTRIIFCEMVGPSELMETTGFGISSMCQDEEANQRLIVDVVDQTVSWFSDPYDGELVTKLISEYMLISFNEVNDEWETIRQIAKGF